MWCVCDMCMCVYMCVYVVCMWCVHKHMCIVWCAHVCVVCTSVYMCVVCACVCMCAHASSLTCVECMSVGLFETESLSLAVLEHSV